MYRYREAHTGSTADLKKAIDIFEEVLQKNPDESDSLKCVQELLIQRTQMNPTPEDLSRLAQVMECLLVQSAERGKTSPTAHFNLGQVYKELYRLQQRTDDVEKAIHHLELALQSRETTVQWTARYLLGFLLRDRGRQMQRVDNLHSAVAVWHRALEGSSPEISHYEEIVLNVGVLLKDIFEMTQQQADLQTAITYYQYHLRTTANKTDLYSLLGYSLLRSYEWFHTPTDLDQALNVLQKALRGSRDLEDRAGHLHNLGNAFNMRFEARGNKKDQQQAQKYHREAQHLWQRLK